MLAIFECSLVFKIPSDRLVHVTRQLRREILAPVADLCLAKKVEILLVDVKILKVLEGRRFLHVCQRAERTQLPGLILAQLIT